jgi:hypothetical protein
MMIDIAPINHDDMSFLLLVSRVASAVANSIEQKDCYVLTLDNWFDHKWLLFPGQYPRADGTIHNRTPLPCFNPSRIVCQRHFARCNTGDYELVAGTALLHGYDGWFPRKKHRWLSDFSDSAVFIWYSGGAERNGQASMMTYLNTENVKSAWYASFRFKQGWTIAGCKSISRRELTALVSATVPA